MCKMETFISNRGNCWENCAGIRHGSKTGCGKCAVCQVTRVQPVPALYSMQSFLAFEKGLPHTLLWNLPPFVPSHAGNISVCNRKSTCFCTAAWYSWHTHTASYQLPPARSSTKKQGCQGCPGTSCLKDLVLPGAHLGHKCCLWGRHYRLASAGTAKKFPCPSSKVLKFKVLSVRHSERAKQVLIMNLLSN